MIYHTPLPAWRHGLWLAAAVWLAGCGGPSPVVKDSLKVEVVGADPKAGTLTVRGTGLPAAGTDGSQTVKVGAGDAAIGYVGHSIQGELSKDKETWRMENIWPADAAATAIVEEASRRVRGELAEQGRKAYRDVGDSLPAFALYNQNGELVQPAAWRGKRVVLNFIFTRCANPAMCPAATQRMAQLQKTAAAANMDDVIFATMTFDPVHDTPGLMRQYGQAYGLDFRNYQLLTGPEGQVTDLMKDFGILTRQQDGTLQHTMATLLISPEGRVLFRKEGSVWNTDEFMERLKPTPPRTKPAS